MIKTALKEDREDISQDIDVSKGSVLGNPFTHRKTERVKDDRYYCRDRRESLRRYKNYIRYFIQPVFDSDDERVAKQKKVIKKALNEIYKKAKNTGVCLVCNRQEELGEADFIKGIINDRLYYTEEDKLMEFAKKNPLVEKLIDELELLV